jgi:hypothetical protein
MCRGRDDSRCIIHLHHLVIFFAIADTQSDDRPKKDPVGALVLILVHHLAYRDSSIQ